MSRVIRSFALTFSVCILTVFFLVALELIRSEGSENGFCEGEIFSLNFSENKIEAELFGKAYLIETDEEAELVSSAEQIFFPLLMPARPLIWAVNACFV